MLDSGQIMLLLIPLLPLLAGLLVHIAAAASRDQSLRIAPLLALGSVLASAGLSIAAFKQSLAANISVNWLAVPEFISSGSAGVSFIPLSIRTNELMLGFAPTVGVVSFLVLLYAMRDRKHDQRSAQFFANMTLFAGSMLLVLCADSLVLLLIGWELMGLFSYLLIGHKATEKAAHAARRAFWTTRAADFALYFVIFYAIGRLGISQLSEINAAALANAPEAPLLAFLVLLAAVGKSALFPLTFWLADAMEAPTPVSALLHAATMVAAGPYLLALITMQLEGSGEALALMSTWAVWLGGATMLLCGLMALCNREPKRILAYSTASQMGVAVMACGMLLPKAAMAQLIAHAWFKAALFIAAGWLIWQFAAEKDGDSKSDIYEMAGSARSSIWMWVLLLAGVSLAGLFPLGGALAKEAMLSMSAAGGPATMGPQGIFVLLSVIITAAYSARFVGVLCFGKPAGESKPASDPAPDAKGTDSGNASGWMPTLIAAMILALIGSVGALLFIPQGYVAIEFGTATVISIVAILGSAAITLTLTVFRQQAGTKTGQTTSLKPLINYFANGMYLREFWCGFVGGTAEFFAVLAGFSDIKLVDWLATRLGAFGRFLSKWSAWADVHVVDGARFWACEIWWVMKRLHARYMQTGSIQHYMLIVLISAVLLCLLALWALAGKFASMFFRMS